MIELNKWFFVLLANLLILIYILNIILFKPLLKLFKEREAIINDSLSAAKTLNDKKDKSLSLLHSELSQTNEEAKELFKNLRQEGVNIQKEYINKAHDESMKMIEKAREEIIAEASAVKEKLRSDIEKYSEDIVKKLISV